MSNTLSIDAAEWRVLFSANVSRINDFVNQNATLSAEHLKALLEHMDRAKVLASAWAAAAPQAVAQEPAQPIDVQAEAAPPKRKGGWPAGKPRKRQNSQVVQ